MEISALYIYPVKSLRGISLQNAVLTPQGIAHDRRFMLREIKPDGSRRNMACYHDPSMVCFVPEILKSSDQSAEDMIKITFSPKGSPMSGEGNKELLIPLTPQVDKLQTTDIFMHGSPTSGYVMDDVYNKWFSECFGMPVELVYVGENRRAVLGNLSPNTNATPNSDHEQGLALSDVAAVLLVSYTSLGHIARELPSDIQADITKFRPNIVVRGAKEEFEEDFWRELDVNGKKILLTQNCNRCVSLNLDYETGGFGVGPKGKVLANLSKDRRVDPGAKYSPVFGRYGFLGKESHGLSISVGEKTTVVAINDERTTFHWPFKVPS